MPMLSVWKCPVCGAQSEPSQMQPVGWISMSSTTSTPEVFDSWQCAATWATEQNVPVQPV